MRIIFECGLNYFFFLRLAKYFYSSIKKVCYFRNGDYLLQLIDFQQLSKLQNILNLCPKIQIHQEMLFHAVNVLNFRTTADYFRVRIEFFFSSKICGLLSSADYFRVRVIFELIG